MPNLRSNETIGASQSYREFCQWLNRVIPWVYFPCVAVAFALLAFGIWRNL